MSENARRVLTRQSEDHMRLQVIRLGANGGWQAWLHGIDTEAMRVSLTENRILLAEAEDEDQVLKKAQERVSILLLALERHVRSFTLGKRTELRPLEQLDLQS